MHKIHAGVLRFRNEVFPKSRALFQRLAENQIPQALFITCADSRIVPDLITQSEPGDLFICRNVGNIVPPYGDTLGGVSATIEYAVSALEIRHIIVCGHSDCGAMKGILHPETVRDMPTVASWLNHAEVARRIVQDNCPHTDEKERLRALTEENVVAQLDHLKTHPSVASRLVRSDLQIYGWVYRIDTGEIRTFDAELGSFVPLEAGRMPSATPKPRQRAVLA